MKAEAFLINLLLIVSLLLGFLTVQKIYAADCGVMGETYPIQEMDFLDFIQLRVRETQRNGEWQSLQNRMQQDAAHYRDRPKPVTVITRASKTRSWKFDPSVVIDHDVTTQDGKLIAVKGTRINPLVYMPLTKALIFINGDDSDQVRWASEQSKALKRHIKIILVNGSILEVEKKLNSAVYFDQAGKLTSRFRIKYVPAIVIQEGLHLKMKEVSI